MVRAKWCMLCILQAGLLVFLTGCGAGKPSGGQSGEEMNHIKKVGDLAAEYHRDPANKMQWPKDIDTLKAWAIKKDKATEDDFVSTRDKEPYVMLGIVSVMAGPIIHEKTGQDGRMWTVGMRPMPTEEDEKTIEESAGRGKMMGGMGGRVSGH